MNDSKLASGGEWNEGMCMYDEMKSEWTRGKDMQRVNVVDDVRDEKTGQDAGARHVRMRR